VINCRNGVVDLKTKHFYDHSPSQRHLHRANANYNPDATSPRWLQFLQQVFEGDQALIDAIQVYLGYSMMGLTTEHLFFLCYGVGRNGKTTLLETIRNIAGSYGDKSRFETFLQREMSSDVRSMEAVGKLKGKRFIIASEANENTKFDAAKIKELTGGDTLTGTVLHKSQFTFSPTHTLWLACNHRPKIYDNSVALWERVRMIPFQKMFLEKDQDAQLPQRLIDEADGIFLWLVNGAYKYLTEGMGEIPEACRQATQEYKEDNDELFRFCDECLIVEKTHSEHLKSLYEAYLTWAEKSNLSETLSDKAFSSKMVERGFRKKRVKEGNILVGVRVR
jgi:putative DNA primase/helicase